MAEKKESKEVISKDMSLGDVLNKHPEVVEVMYKHGLHCVGCHIAAWETIEQGAASHGIDLKKLLDEMNKAVGKKPKKA